MKLKKLFVFLNNKINKDKTSQTTEKSLNFTDNHQTHHSLLDILTYELNQHIKKDESKNVFGYLKNLLNIIDSNFSYLFKEDPGKLNQ